MDWTVQMQRLWHQSQRADEQRGERGDHRWRVCPGSRAQGCKSIAVRAGGGREQQARNISWCSVKTVFIVDDNEPTTYEGGQPLTDYLPKKTVLHI